MTQNLGRGILAFTGLVLMSFQAAQATTFNYIFTPQQVAAGANGVTFDPDAIQAVADTTTGDPGGSSFVTAITGAGGANNYTGLYFNVNTLFQTMGLTIGDFAGISYNTLGMGQPNWVFTIYTVPNGTDGSGWYNDRFTGTGPPSSTSWVTTDANSAGFFGLLTSRSGGTTTSTPGFNQSLAQLGQNPTYANEPILYFYLDAGSSGNTSPITDNLDGLMLLLNNGDIVNIDFVPEPPSLVYCAAGLAALFVILARRRAARN